LGDNVVFLCQLREQTGFIDGVNEWFLHIDVFSGCDCLSGNDGVGVVGSCNHHGISLIEQFGKHLAVVLVAFCLGVFLEYVVGILEVDITQSDDFFGFHFSQVGSTAPPDSHTEDFQLAVERLGVACCFVFLGSGCEHVAWRKG